METWRRWTTVLTCVVMTLLAGCAGAPTPLAWFPDFPKAKPALGTLVILGDVTSLHYKSGDIQKLDLAESEQLGSVLLNEIARGLQQKGYAVGRTVHATVGWILRPGTQVYLVRTAEDRDKDPLPLAEPPFYVSQELASEPALKEAWQTLRLSLSAEAQAGAALSRLGQAFGADTFVIVAVAGRYVPVATQSGRAMLSALTFGATDAPVTTVSKMIVFVDPRSGRILWQDAGPALHTLFNERGMKGVVEEIVHPLP